MPTNPEVQMEQEDAITCIHLCMQIGGPQQEFIGSINKAFPSRIILEGAPLRTIQEIWRKYYINDRKKAEEVLL
jgi:hypothetical protein